MNDKDLIQSKLSEVKDLVAAEQYNLFIKLLSDKLIYPSRAILAETQNRDNREAIQILNITLNWLKPYRKLRLTSSQAELLFSLIIRKKDQTELLLKQLESLNLLSNESFMELILGSKAHFTVIFHLVQMITKSSSLWRDRGLPISEYTKTQALSDTIPLISSNQNLPVLAKILTKLQTRRAKRLFSYDMNSSHHSHFYSFVKVLFKISSPDNLLEAIELLLRIHKTCDALEINIRDVLRLCQTEQSDLLVQRLTHLCKILAEKERNLSILIKHYPNSILPLLIQPKTRKQTFKRLEWMSRTIPLDAFIGCTREQIEKVINQSIANKRSAQNKLIVICMLGLFKFAKGSYDISNFVTNKLRLCRFNSLQSTLLIILLAIHPRRSSFLGIEHVFESDSLINNKPTSDPHFFLYNLGVPDILIKYDYLDQYNSNIIEGFFDLVRMAYGLPFENGTDLSLYCQLRLLDFHVKDKLIHQKVCDHLTYFYNNYYNNRLIWEQNKVDKTAPTYNPGMFSNVNALTVCKEAKKYVMYDMERLLTSIGLLQEKRLFDSELGPIYLDYLFNNRTFIDWTEELIDLHRSDTPLYWKEWFAWCTEKRSEHSPKTIHTVFDTLAKNQLLSPHYVKLIMSNPDAKHAVSALIRLNEKNSLPSCTLVPAYQEAVCVSKNPELLVDNLLELLNQGTINLNAKEVCSWIVASQSPELLTSVMVILLKHNVSWLTIKTKLVSCNDMEALAAVLKVINGKVLWEDESYTSHLTRLIAIKDTMKLALYIDRYPKVSKIEKEEYEPIIQPLQLNISKSNPAYANSKLRCAN